MKKLLTFLALIPTLLFGQTPTMRQVASAGTTITRLPAVATTTVAATDTIMIFKSGIWKKTTVSAITTSGGSVPLFPALEDQVLRANGTGGIKANGNSYIDDDGNMSIEGDFTIIDDSKKFFIGLLPALRVTGGGSILNVGDGSIRNIEMDKLVGIGTGTATPVATLQVVGTGYVNQRLSVGTQAAFPAHSILEIRDIDTTSVGSSAFVGADINIINSTTSGITSSTMTGISVLTQTNSGKNIPAGGFIGINSRLTANASQTGTVADARSINIATPSYVLGFNKPTTNYGLYVNNQGIAGVTTSYGIFVSSQFNSTTNYGIASQALLNGFGTITPTTALHVAGSIRMVDGSEGNGKVMTSNATGVGNWQTPSAASVSAWGLPGNALTGSEHSPTEFFGSTNNFDVVFKENNAEVMRLINGNVGIGTGTATPTEKLEVNGNIELSGGTRRINFDDGSDIGYIFYDSNNDGLTFSGGGSGLYMDGSVIVASNLNVNGNIGSGTWQGAVIAGQYGGTGVANTGKTITLGGNLTTTGAFNTTFAQGFTGTITLPTATSTLYSTQTGSITSAQMATSVTGETGTGALVFGTAPTVSTLSVTNTAVIGATGNGVSPTGWALDVRTPSATNGGAIIGGTASGDRAVKIFQSSAGYAYLNGYGRTAGASTDLSFQLDGGNVGIGLTTPTDLLSIKAGTTSLAPILLTSGPLTTGGNIRAGQVQFLTDDYYATITTGTAVHKIARVLTGSATLDFANLVSLGCEDLTVTVTGAVDGDDVVVSPPNGSVVANSDYSAWVSAANTVTVRFCTFISGNPASGTFKVTVIKN